MDCKTIDRSGKSACVGGVCIYHNCVRYDYSKLRDEVSRLRAASQWQPIKTALLDTAVLVYASPAYDLPGFQTTAQYHPDAGWCVDELREVTHWMPLPAPPL